MSPNEFAGQVDGIATLAEPVRRDLYLHVVAQPDPVSRDQAADGVGVARHTAKFHLDRLVAEGLLDTQFRRPSGRGGPGAGRPTKLYLRSQMELSVTLPARRYDLAGQLMAQAIDDSMRDGTPVRDALFAATAKVGAADGAAARETFDESSTGDRVDATCRVLAARGYEPRVQDSTITLVNCPFHALSRAHTELVCGMNLTLLGALVDQLDEGRVTARLDPAPGRCCVTVTVR